MDLIVMLRRFFGLFAVKDFAHIPLPHAPPPLTRARVRKIYGC